MDVSISHDAKIARKHTFLNLRFVGNFMPYHEFPLSSYEAVYCLVAIAAKVFWAEICSHEVTTTEAGTTPCAPARRFKLLQVPCGVENHRPQDGSAVSEIHVRVTLLEIVSAEVMLALGFLCHTWPIPSWFPL
jgi:hypothetical protein